VEIGTVLGMLYGVVTDVVLIYRGFFLSDAEAVGRWGVAVAACFGGGIILGAILDRMTDALIAWWKGTPILGKRRS
jgi:hypothetical protein